MKSVVHPSSSRRAWVANSRAVFLAIYAAGTLGLHNCLHNALHNEDAPQAPYEVVERLSVVKNMPISALAWQLKMQGGDRDESGNHESHDPASKALPDSTADSGDRGSTSSKNPSKEGRPIPENALPLSGDCLYEALPVASGKLDTTFPVPPENPDLAFSDEFRTDRLCRDTNIDNSGGVSQGPTAATGSGDPTHSVQEQGVRTDSGPQGLRHQNVNVDLCQTVDFFSRTVQEPKMLHLMHSPVKIQSPQETASLEGRPESREEEPQIEETQKEEAQKEETQKEESQKEETQEEESQKEEAPGSLVGSEQACMQEDTRCHETELNKAVDGKKRRKLECDVCGKWFDRIRNLTVHMRKHTGEKPFECNFAGCNQSFTTAGNLKRHMLTHTNTGEKSCKCTFGGCNRSFVTAGNLKRHMLIHTRGKPKMHSPRGVQSPRETTFEERHEPREEEAQEEEAQKEESPIEEAQEEEAQEEEAQKEEAQEEESPGSLVGSEQACMQEDTRCHETELNKAADDTKKPHKCNVCGRRFTRKPALMFHVMTHTGEKPHKCTFEGCEKRYAQNSELKRHMRTHTGEKPYLCDVAGCDKGFADRTTLRTHKLTHTGEKPYKCTFEGCNTSFSVRGNLLTHERIHTGERPHKCDFEGCDQRFVRRAHLQAHILTHTGEKPHKCTVEGCAWSFAKRAGLKRHMKRHK